MTGPKPIKRKTALSRNYNTRPRTNGSVVNALSKGFITPNPKTSSETAKYAMCRLNPFASNGNSLGIPDGSSARKIVVDHRMYCDIIVGTQGQFVLKTMPCLPVPLLIKQGVTKTTGSTLQVNGFDINTNLTDQGNLKQQWYPAMSVPEWKTWAGTTITSGTASRLQGLADKDPYSSSRARMVTQCFRMFYTGSANDCAGQMIVQRDPITFDDSSITFNPLAINYDNVAGAQATFAVNNVYTGLLSNSTDTTTINPEAYMQRLEAGAQILTPHASDDYSWRKTYPYGLVFVNPSENATTNEASFISLGKTGSTNCATAWIDQDWESMLIQVSGMKFGSSVRVELIQCMEYQVTEISAFNKLAKIGGPADKIGIETVSTVVKSVPAAIPIQQSFYGFVKNALANLGAKAKEVGNYFGPTGALVGNVASPIMQAISSAM
jgi:hypothetical protein